MYLHCRECSGFDKSFGLRDLQYACMNNFERCSARNLIYCKTMSFFSQTSIWRHSIFVRQFSGTYYQCCSTVYRGVSPLSVCFSCWNGLCTIDNIVLHISVRQIKNSNSFISLLFKLLETTDEAWMEQLSRYHPKYFVDTEARSIASVSSTLCHILQVLASVSALYPISRNMFRSFLH